MTKEKVKKGEETTASVKDKTVLLMVALLASVYSSSVFSSVIGTVFSKVFELPGLAALFAGSGTYAYCRARNIGTFIGVMVGLTVGLATFVLVGFFWAWLMSL